MREKYNGYKSTFGRPPEPPQKGGNGKGFLCLWITCVIAAAGCFGWVGSSLYSQHQIQEKKAAQALQESQAAAVQRRMTVFPKAPNKAVSADMAAPTYDSAATSTDGTKVLIQLTEADSPPILPATGVTGFTVKVNGVARTITGASAESETEVIGYNATGAGDATWDGDYFNDGTTSAGGLRFKLDSTHYLWYQVSATRWLFYPESDEGLSNEAYRTDTGQSSTDPSGLSYTLGVSAQPGPTVTAITSAASNTVTLTVAGKIYIGDAITVEYDSATGNVTDSAGTPNSMASFGAQAVTNNSTVPRPAAYRPVVWDEENSRPKRLGEGEEINAYIPANINPVQTLTDGATITWDVGNNPIEKAVVTLGGNRTLDITGAGSGQQGVLFVQQDATGGRTLALPANSKVVSDGGGVVTLSTTADAIDAIAFLFDGTNYYWTKGLSFS